MSPVFQPEQTPDDAQLAIQAWNVMGGIDWAALPLVCEMFGVDDPEKLVRQLCAIRDHKAKGAERSA